MRLEDQRGSTYDFFPGPARKKPHRKSLLSLSVIQSGGGALLLLLNEVVCLASKGKQNEYVCKHTYTSARTHTDTRTYEGWMGLTGRTLITHLDPVLGPDIYVG